MVSEALYFGTAKTDGVVSPADWRTFLDTEVTPRFPQGLSVWQASGQWRSESGQIIREPSYVLNIVHAGGRDTEAAVVEIAGRYKIQFRQEAVLRTRGNTCVSF